MSSGYSANQYDRAFKPQRMQNWCVAKHLTERPTAHEGHTTFIADDRGHLLPGVSKRKSAWPDYKGTWDLPAHLPACSINHTGRSLEGLNRIKAWGLDPQHTSTSQPSSGSTNRDRPQGLGEQTNEDVQQDRAAPPPMTPTSRPPSAAAARPESQNHPITGGERPASQHRALSAAVDKTLAHSAKDTQVTQATVKD